MVIAVTSEVPFSAGSGSYLSASAYNVSAPSAPSSEWTGNATIRRQSLNIEYYRQPDLLGTIDYYQMSLSSISGAPLRLAGSYLRFKVTASVKQDIISGTWAGSSLLVPQTFQINNTNYDSHGNLYDGVSAVAGASGVLGPAGTIVTLHDGVSRRPYQAGDVAYVSSVTNAQDHGSVSGATNRHYWGDWMLDNYAVGKTDWDPFPLNTHGHTNYMYGPYHPTKETNKDIKRFIEMIGNDLATHGYWITNYSLPNSDELVGINTYDTNLHNYT